MEKAISKALNLGFIIIISKSINIGKVNVTISNTKFSIDKEFDTSKIESGIIHLLDISESLKNKQDKEIKRSSWFINMLRKCLHIK